MSALEKKFSGSIVEITNNTRHLYEGDLRHYVRIIFSAPNIYNGYHGLRHMLHVTWVCYLACEYYANLGEINGRRMRNLLIAALFHDYGHAGRPVKDSDNIKVAEEAMRKSLLPEDIDFVGQISEIIRATQFPHADLGITETLEQTIIRDADMSQSFGTAWIGQILAGFGSELSKGPIEMLWDQKKFLKAVHFHSSFGQTFFGDEAIKEKMIETEGLLDILLD